MESSRFLSRFAMSTLPPKLKGFTERRCLYCWLMRKKFVTITWIRARFQRLWRGVKTYFLTRAKASWRLSWLAMC